MSGAAKETLSFPQVDTQAGNETLTSIASFHHMPKGAWKERAGCFWEGRPAGLPERIDF